MPNDKKHMDIAKPGTADPETGGKPMVIGHKKVADDIVTDAATESQPAEQPAEENEAKKPKKKLDLQPISNLKDLTSDDSEDSAQNDESPKEDAGEPSTETEPADTDTDKSGSEDTPADSSDEEPLKDEDSEADKTNQRKENKESTDEAKEKRLQEIITSKEYYVPIKESHTSSLQTFVMAFLVTLLIASIALVLLMDADVIDLGVEAPTNFL